MIKRTVYQKLFLELIQDKNMILISGPRQCGKTTFSEMISVLYSNTLYFNWDIPDHRIELLKNPYFFERVERSDNSTPLIIFDEIHKYKGWKNYLKGLYDKFKSDYNYIVTGSGRLDLYQKGNDSLAGRYLMFHLWPLTLSELKNENNSLDEFLKNPLKVSNCNHQDTWNDLLSFSGFPEPFLKKKENSYKRWSSTYTRQLIREDIQSLADIKNINDFETLYHLLPDKIAGPLSIPSLSKDLKVSYNTISSWLSVLERFYMIFSVTPWSKSITRSIHKEKKVYLWDIPKIPDRGPRFENAVAIELLRMVTSMNEWGYGHFGLHYLKNKEKEEADFLITHQNKPFLIIETKTQDESIPKSLIKFQNMLNIPAVLLTHEGTKFKIITNGENKILISPAHKWLSMLP